MHRRGWIILLAIFLSILAIFIPLMLAYYLSWSSALRYEKNRLDEVTSRLIERIRLTYLEVQSTLIQLNELKHIILCSPEHIRIMRDMTINSPVIEEINYIKNDIKQCGAWGKNISTITSPTQFTDEIITQKGIKISLNRQPTGHQNIKLISLRLGNYDILVNSSEFSNIIIDSTIKLAVLAKNGTIISSANNPDIKFDKNYLFGNIKQTETKNYLISVKPNKEFIAIATEDKSLFYATFYRQQLILIPLGILMTLPIIIAILYFSRRSLSIKSELKHAIEHNQLTVYYQPIVELKSGKCIGAEALIRWFSAKNEAISPDFFIPIAEKAGLISKLTKFVINTVIKDMQYALDADRNMHISINFTVQDFQDQEILKFLDSKLKNTKINSSQLWLELTERQLVQFETATDVFKSIRAMNYKIAIDDFGTGYSNLSYLNKFELDILKIDKSFIDTVDMDAVTSGITEHIIMMAKHVRLMMIAEGVETPKQRNYLIKNGVQYAQGLLYSKALNKDDFLNYYRTHQMTAAMTLEEEEVHS